MNAPCEGCHRPTGDGATICSGCAHQLDQALADITAYRGLAFDLQLAATRQTQLGRGGILNLTTTGTSEKPVPFDERASRISEHLRGVLGSWARLIIEETGAGTVPTFGPTCRTCRHRSCREIRTRGLPDDTLASIAGWLRPRVGWLRHHPAGGEAFDEILSSVREARRAIDRRADTLYAGPCSECGTDLYAIPGALTVTCRTCELVYEVAARREWLLRALDDHLANATQMSRLVTYLGIKLADSSIRTYANRGRIASHGTDAKGYPLYRLGEVVRTYYTPAARKAS